MAILNNQRLVAPALRFVPGLGERREGLCNEIQLHTRAERGHHAQAQLLANPLYHAIPSGKD